MLDTQSQGNTNKLRLQILQEHMGKILSVDGTGSQ